MFGFGQKEVKKGASNTFTLVKGAIAGGSAGALGAYFLRHASTRTGYFGILGAAIGLGITGLNLVNESARRKNDAACPNTGSSNCSQTSQSQF